MTLKQVPLLTLELLDSYTMSGLSAEPGLLSMQITELTEKSKSQILQI